MGKFDDEAMYNQYKEWEAAQNHYASEDAKAEANIKAQEEDTMTKQKFTVDDALRIYDNEGLVGVVEAVKRIKDAEFKKEKALMFNPDWKPDVQAILAEHNEAVIQIEAECQHLRQLLWATHPCQGKYGDDGELQCNRYVAPIDFKRDSVSEIERKIPIHNKDRQDNDTYNL